MDSRLAKERVSMALLDRARPPEMPLREDTSMVRREGFEESVRALLALMVLYGILNDVRLGFAVMFRPAPMGHVSQSRFFREVL